MNKKHFLIGMAGLVLLTAATAFVKAQQAAPQAQQSIQKYECAMIKWEGPDKIQVITPSGCEVIRVFKQPGISLPKDIHDEEFCVTWACNKMGQEGWEPIQLHATRVMFKRPIK